MRLCHDAPRVGPLAVLLAAGLALASCARWTSPVLDVAPLPSARSAHAAAVCDGDIFVVGGGGRDDRRAWRYAVDRDEWSPIADAPRPRAFGAVGAWRGRVYSVAGLSSPKPRVEEYPAEVDCYDPSTDSWSTAGTMPSPRGRVGSLQMGNELWIVGGYEQGVGNLARVDVLDLETLVWSRAPDLPETLHGCAVAAVGDEVLVVGNQRNGERAWRLSESRHAWERIPDAPTPRLFAVGIATERDSSRSPAFVVLGHRSRERVRVLGYVGGPDGWRWKLGDPYFAETHRMAAVALDGFVYSIAGETVDGETARVERLDLSAIRWIDPEGTEPVGLTEAP